jgi:hypothetical protein
MADAQLLLQQAASTDGPGLVSILIEGAPNAGRRNPDPHTLFSQPLFVCKLSCSWKGFGKPVLRIRIRDPGWVESQHPDPGSGMINPDHIFFLELSNHFFGSGIRVGKKSDPG